MTAATVAAPANSINFGTKESNRGLTSYTMSHAWLTAETDEANDAVEFGYLPAGVTVIAFANVVADLDSGTALRQTISIGSTDFTANALASTGGNAVTYIVPLVLTAPTLVKVTTTTGATGHQNGTQYLTFLYSSS